MNSVINIKAKLPNGMVRDFRFAVPRQRPWVLEYQGPDGIARICEAHDLFQALVQVRQEFEQEGYRLLCVGSRRDVTPSRMSRSMSGGRKAYIVRRGVPASKADIVDIFDYAEPEVVGTVKEQQENIRAWFDSIKIRQ